MNAMKMPGFTAETALYRTSHCYHADGWTVQGMAKNMVVAQLPGCESGAPCSVRTPSTQIDVCQCPPGQSCRPRCSPRSCEVNPVLCALFPPWGCIPQCSPGVCTLDGFCQDDGSSGGGGSSPSECCPRGKTCCGSCDSGVCDDTCVSAGQSCP